MVLVHIASLANEEGEALVNIDQAAAKLGIGPMQVEVAMFRLKQEGFIDYREADTGDTQRVQIQVDRL